MEAETASLRASLEVRIITVWRPLLKRFIFFCLTASVALIVVTSQDAQATCSFICEGSIIDDSCQSILPTPGSDTAVWTDAARAPLLAVSCQVQCCAPGMCSDPTTEQVAAADLQLLNVKGMDLMGTFQEERSPLCQGKQVFSIQSALTSGEVYDAAHQRLILSRFKYEPMVLPPDDMGTGDVDMGSEESDMGMTGGEEDMSVEVDMAIEELDMGRDEVDLGDEPDMGVPGGGEEMDDSSAADMGSQEEMSGEEEDSSQSNGEDEDAGCQTASGSLPSDAAPLGLLGLGLLFGVRRRHRQA